MQNVPDYLFHKIHGGNSVPDEEQLQWALGQIKEQGLEPMVAREWCHLVPEQIRKLPIVWMAESESEKGQWLKIATETLDQSRLFRLELDDVKWWVYQGHIPVYAVRVPQ